MANTAKKAKKPAKKAPAVGKDKILMSVIRDCSEHPWCGYTMEIAEGRITYQKPRKGVLFIDLLHENVSVEANTEFVEVTL